MSPRRLNPHWTRGLRSDSGTIVLAANVVKKSRFRSSSSRVYTAICIPICLSVGIVDDLWKCGRGIVGHGRAAPGRPRGLPSDAGHDLEKKLAMSVQLTASSLPKEAPAAKEYLVELINERMETLQDLKTFSNGLAQELSLKSAKHKFLISVTKVAVDKSGESDIAVRSSISAVWDESRDGYFTFKAVCEDIYYVTIFWVYMD